MGLPLLCRSLRSISAVVLAIAVVLVFYIGSVVYLYDPEVSESLRLMQEAMPELFAAFGMANPSDSLCDFLLNYLYGFMFAGALVLLAVYMAQRLVVGPAKDGSLVWLLASPHSRFHLAFTLMAAEVAAVFAFIALLWASEVVFCELLFPGDLDQAALARANMGLIALGLFAASLCFASGCVFQRPGLGLWVGAGACALFLLMGLAAAMGEGLEWLASASPFSLYDAYGLAAGDEGAAMKSLALLGTSVALFAAGLAAFCRRDFSL